jgi:uncharacterized membrane protein YbhN (UPF0104 family)
MSQDPRTDHRAAAGRAGRLLAVIQSPRTTWSLLAVAVGLGGWALVAQREQALAALALIDLRSLVLAVLAGAAVVLCSAMIWRTVLADLGSPLPLLTAWEIFLLGQVGKYLPGSVWPIVMQAQLGARYGVSKRRTLAASVVTMLMSVATASMIIVLTLPLRPDVGGGTRWLGLLAVPVVVLLHPAVLGRLLDVGLRLVRRRPLQARTTARGTVTAFAWSLLTWVFSGALVLSLAHPLGVAPSWRSVALAGGGYALAWLVGLLVVVAPAGAGAREGVLVVLLATVLPTGSALVVALITRLVFTAVDLAAAGLAVLAARRVRLS